MQQIQYFKSAWGDIKNSHGWFGKLCLLALINFIPIFGQIVTLGYLYGWASEIAWGTHEPMPARIFGNEDGKLYRRGWFVLVLTFVFALVPSIIMGIGSSMQGAGLWGVASNAHAVGSSIMSGVGLLLYLVGLVGVLLLAILAWIGSMRISIYDRLSAGFQLSKIWKMFRHDTGGIMRIFGMNLLVSFIIGIVLSIVYFIVFFLIIFAGVAGLAASGYNVSMMQHMTDAQAAAMTLQFVASAGVVGFLGILVLVFITYVAQVFVLLLVARAMGYWTMQFDVPHWCGQDDPMPFETAPPAATAAQAYPTAPVTNAPDAGMIPPTAPAPQQQQTDWYGQPLQQTQQVGQAQPAPVVAPVPMPAPAADAPVADAPAAEVTAPIAEDSYAEPTGADEAPAAEAAVEAPEAAEPESIADEATPVEPGQLSGFTYTGVTTPPAQVTPSGADPSDLTPPDLLVVVPEEAAPESPAEGEEAPQE